MVIASLCLVGNKVDQLNTFAGRRRASRAWPTLVAESAEAGMWARGAEGPLIRGCRWGIRDAHMGQHGFHTPAGGGLPRHRRPQRARQARGRDVGWPMREMGCTLPAASGVSHWSGAAGDCQAVGLLFLVFLFCPQGAGFAGTSDQFTLAGGKRCEAGTCLLTLARHVVEIRAACGGEGCKRQRRTCGDRQLWWFEV